MVIPTIVGGVTNYLGSGGEPDRGSDMTMHAAVVRSFDRPPRYDTYETPQPAGPHEVLVDVLAAGLHPRVRTAASGRHYTSDGVVPMFNLRTLLLRADVT